MLLYVSIISGISALEAGFAVKPHEQSDSDIVFLEKILQYRDDGLIGARGLKKEKLFDDNFDEECV